MQIPTTTNELGLGPAWNEILVYYQIKNKVGEGSFGDVYRAKCVLTSQTVAIKHIKGFSKNDYDFVKLIREI